MRRSPSVKPASFAGIFYPQREEDLREQLREFQAALDARGAIRLEGVRGIASPHAGYRYSGQVAASAFHSASALSPQTVVILGLAHRVRLEGVSILDSPTCETPLGEVACDLEFRERLERKVPFAHPQWEAHLSEHSTETQMPFVKFFFPGARVVEILTQDYSAPIPEQLGAAIAETAADLDREILVVASTDLSHYPNAETAKTLDRASLETLCHLDTGWVRENLGVLERQGLPGVTCAVCSKASVLAGIEASRHLGARSGQRLDYLNSGDSPMGDPARVVGYGAIAWRD